MSKTVDTFLVDIGNVLLDYDADIFHAAVARVVRRDLMEVKGVYEQHHLREHFKI